MSKVDVAIIGGGFYGCCLAIYLRKFFDKIVILEKEDNIMKRASSINQSRVHTGFHYPRSFSTAYRSLVNFPRFTKDFRKAIVDDFTKIYAIAKVSSKVNSAQFYKIFKQMGAQIDLAPVQYQTLFDRDLIEEIFKVTEYAFDISILREIIREKLEAAAIQVNYSCEIKKVEKAENDHLHLILPESGLSFTSNNVFNCTYSQINKLLNDSGIDLLPLKHELAELALIEVPDCLKNIGITIMDGPFFSTMPYPPKDLHSLSHVSYTPHYSWIDYHQARDGHQMLKENSITSNFSRMIQDAKRFVPILGDSTYVESLYEIKTVLIENENDDGRPILYSRDYGFKNFSTILGGKIDNVYDLIETMGQIKKSINHEQGSWSFL